MTKNKYGCYARCSRRAISRSCQYCQRHFKFSGCEVWRVPNKMPRRKLQ